MLLRALFVRPTRRRPLRFAVTVLGVAAGVAAVVATLASSRAAITALGSGVEELSGRAVLEVRAPGGVPLEVLAALRPLAPEAVIAPVVEEVALCPALQSPVRVLGVDPLSDPALRDLGPEIGARLADGAARERFLELLRGEGAWIGAAIARDAGLARGGDLELDVRARLVRLRVLGVLPARGGALDRVVLLDVARAQEVRGDLARLDRIELAPRAGADASGLRDRALALLPAGVEVSSPRERAAATRGLVRSLEFNLTALSGISLFVGAVLVATTLATSVVQRARTIAVLRALGASAGQVRAAILVEAAAIGVLGGVGGTALGFAGARALLPRMQATVASVVSGAPPSAIRFAWDHAALGLALGVLVSLAAALLPVLEGARTPPIQHLRGEAPAPLSDRARRVAVAIALFFALLAVELVQLPAWRGLPVAALVASLCGLGVLFALLSPGVDGLRRLASALPRLPVPLRLACAALAAGRRRAAWAAGAVGVAVALSVSIGVMVHSFRQSVVDWSDASLHADLVVRPLVSREGVPVGRLDPDAVEVAARAVGGGALDPYHQADARFRGEAITLAASELGLPARTGAPPLVDGSSSLAALRRAHDEGGCLVNEAFARRFGFEAGERLRLQVGGVPLERRIEGVVRDYGDSRGIVTIDRRDFLTLFPADAPLQVSVHLGPDADRAAARAALERDLGARFQVEVLSNADLRGRVLSVFERTFAITSALQGVSALVAVIAVLSVLFALVSERSADLALLSALGADRAQVRGVVVGQAGLLGLLGAASGAAVGVVVGVILVTVVNVQSFGWTLDVHLPHAALATTVAAVVVACAVAGLLPARAAAPERLRGALREE